jgi:Flp pilus assembly protein TadG
MVEFALISTLLIGLTMAMIQYGIIFNTTISLTNLSREGARYAAVHAGADAPIQSYIESTLPAGISAADLTVTVSPPEGSAQRTKGNPITVTVSYPMSRKLFLPSKFLGMPIFNANYTTSGRMMIES